MKKLFAALMIAVFIGLPGYALAAEKLTVAVADWPPYTFEENGKLTGIIVETIIELCKRNGFEADIHLVPWKRALKEMEEGSSGAIAAPIYTEERAKFLYYPSEPINIEKTVFLGLKESGIKVSKLDDLKDKSIGLVRGYKFTPEFDNHPGIKKVECDDDKQLVKILGAKRIEFAIGEEAALKYLSKQAGIQVETAQVLTETKGFLGLSKKALGEKGKELAEKFSKTLQDLNKEGFIEKVKSKYF